MLDPAVQAVITDALAALNTSNAEVSLIVLKISRLPPAANPAETVAALAPIVASVAQLGSGITQISQALDALVPVTPVG